VQCARKAEFHDGLRGAIVDERHWHEPLTVFAQLLQRCGEIGIDAGVDDDDCRARRIPGRDQVGHRVVLLEAHLRHGRGELRPEHVVGGDQQHWNASRVAGSYYCRQFRAWRSSGG
jgi:hypothetical protein